MTRSRKTVANPLPTLLPDQDNTQRFKLLQDYLFACKLTERNTLRENEESDYQDAVNPHNRNHQV
ncbi:MAG: hypothetical protein KAT58_10160, partial [candidate division Zixibacteria bacterium]|nr:hypothetical protein [candidate division Zixibacteria bacterium]